MGNFLGPTQAGVGLDSDLLESGLRPGSACVARLARPAESAESAESDGWEYIYGTVTSLQPPCIHGCDGADYTADALRWVAAARDDGWLEPYGKEWREPGRAIFLRLLRDEWVTAFVGLTGPDMPFSYLPLEGVDGLPGVDVLKEVGMLFTPHEECREEFQHLEPGRGGFLADHLSKAFVLGSKSQQRLRWVKKCRSEPQYPMRCVFVHPRVKCRGLAEFVRRCHVKRAECPQEIAAEAVVLLGPPAAGKSSIQRLDAQQLPQELRHTVESLKYREEVNNDNLTDCMPGFEKEFRVALQMPKESQAGGAHWRKMLKVVKRDTRSLAWAAQALKDKSEEYKSAIAWAIQWLTYAMFHHGPVRDSLAWDIIKVSIVDAAELPVFYSSVMAGAAIDRTMEVLELAHSGAADKKGHFHAQQAEENITKMLKSLKLGQKPTDCGDTNISTEVKVDHFVVAWREERAWRSQREASCLFPNSWKLWGLCPNKLWGGSQRFLAAPNPCGLLGAIEISLGLILQSLAVRRTGLKGLPVRKLHSKRGQPMLYGLSAAFCCDSALLILLRAGSRLIRSLLGSVVERPSSVEPKGPGRKPGRKSIRQRPTLGLQSTP
ncbi:unnamed protein product [Effrenium voratum]|nr:unnamed protein product [Effrenium voratum]